VDLNFTDDQVALRDAFASLFAKASPSSVVRAAEPLGFDPTIWEHLVQTGVPMMAVPEAAGGGGASFVDLVVVAQEFGRRVAPVPLVECIVASNLLAAAGAPEAVMAGLLDGTILATVALQPLVEGFGRLVPAGAVAEVVVALDGDDFVCLRRAGGARPHPSSPSPLNLGSSPLGDWRADDPEFERTVLASGPAARALHTRARSEWELLTAAALDGVRAEALAIGVEYVKNRWAFGVPIGWFQAIQHRLADVATAGDGAQLLVYEAAWARDEGRPEADALAAMAFLALAEVAQKTTRESLQFHGGYGYTLEYDIQLYFRRAKAWPLSLGDPSREYQRLAHLLFTDAA
jgi:alkylation response protein AidB-like acyl-CoA dehydrogenase